MSEAGCPPRVHSAKKRPCRPMNPFAYRERNNFPGLDFGMADAKQKAEADYSTTSEGSSCLNMSIGARAALNEHMRNVAKYGIDGERPVSDKKCAQTPRNAMDEHWDNILDGNTPLVDLNGSFAALSSSPRRLDVMLSDQDGSEYIDVKTDISLDFFNSSRVLMLATPEKNRKLTKNTVDIRDEVQQEETYQEDDSEGSSYANMAPELKGSPGISLNSTERTSTFVSFSLAEMSQISNAGSEVRRSPDESFDGRWTIEENAVSPIKEMGTPSRFQDSPFAPSSQQRFMRNSSTSSSSSTSRRTPPRDTSFPRTSSTPGLPVLDSIPIESNFKERSTRQDSNSSDKENNFKKNMTSTFGYSPAVSPFVVNSGISPAAILAGAQASQMIKDFSRYGACLAKNPADLWELRELALSRGGLSKGTACLAEENAFDRVPEDFLHAIKPSKDSALSPISQTNLSENAFDRMPADFLHAIKSFKDSALSPISQTNLSVIDIASTVGSASGDGSEESFLSIQSPKRLRAESPSPSAPLTAQYSPRHSHTAVPSNLFRDSLSGFPDECDTFSAPALRLNRSENDRTRKSLINSFEEAYFP
jgi:hypothetical protein